MSTDLVTCEFDASLRTVAGRMVDRRVGSVLVYRDGDAAGIVTETDLIGAEYRTRRPLSEIRASTAMSQPLVTVEGDRTLRRATERMAAEGVKKLPVADDLTVVGIVTLTDVTYHFSDIKREIHELEQRSFRERAP